LWSGHVTLRIITSQPHIIYSRDTLPHTHNPIIYSGLPTARRDKHRLSSGTNV